MFADAPPVRAELPIREVVMPDGARRYAVMIDVAGRPVLAGLDTGSVGLRVLPGGLPAGAGGGPDLRYGYNSGVRLVGPAARVPLAFGALAGEAAVQAVRAVGCTDLKPDCVALHMPIERFRIMGDGAPDAGFEAILGIGMGAADPANPLAQLGAHRWIVRLPRPDEAGDGALILNPDAAEAAGFTPVPMADGPVSRQHDSVQACLFWDGQRFCAPTVLDTGAPGLKIVNADVPPPTGQTHGAIVFGEPGVPAATLDFTLNRRGDASRITSFTQPHQPGPRLFAGLTAYFGYDVLYDADAHTIAFKPRRPMAGGLTGTVGRYPG